MGALHGWRKLARGLTIASFAGQAAVAIGSLVLILVSFRVGGESVLDRMIPALGTLGLFAVLAWSILDARRRWERRPSGRVASAEEEAGA